MEDDILAVVLKRPRGRLVKNKTGASWGAPKTQAQRNACRDALTRLSELYDGDRQAIADAFNRCLMSVYGWYYRGFMPSSVARKFADSDEVKMNGRALRPDLDL